MTELHATLADAANLIIRELSKLPRFGLFNGPGLFQVKFLKVLQRKFVRFPFDKVQCRIDLRAIGFRRRSRRRRFISSVWVTRSILLGRMNRPSRHDCPHTLAVAYAWQPMV